MMMVAKALHVSYMNLIPSLSVVDDRCYHKVRHVYSWRGSMKSSQKNKYKEKRSVEVGGLQDMIQLTC